MNTIKSWGLALLLAVAVLAPVPARAATLECDQTTTGLRLCLPRYGTDFDQWATATVNAFSVVNSSSMLSSTSAINTSAWLQTSRIGGISTGPVGIWISSAATFTSSATFAHADGLAAAYGVKAGSVSVTRSGAAVGNYLFSVKEGATKYFFDIADNGVVNMFRNPTLTPSVGLNIWTGFQWGAGGTVSTGTNTGALNMANGAGIAMTGDINGKSVVLTGGVSAATGTFTVALDVWGSSFTVGGSTLNVNGGKVGISTPTGNGNLRVRAGNGVGGGTAPIIIYAASLSSTTGDTNSTNWIIGNSFTVPANTLINNGDLLEVFCVASATTTSLTKGIEFTINGQRTANGATTTTDTRWQANAQIWRTSGTNIAYSSERRRDSTIVADRDSAVATTLSADFTVTCDIRSSATAYPAASGDENMKLEYMRVTLHPAP